MEAIRLLQFDQTYQSVNNIYGLSSFWLEHRLYPPTVKSHSYLYFGVYLLPHSASPGYYLSLLNASFFVILFTPSFPLYLLLLSLPQICSLFLDSI